MTESLLINAGGAARAYRVGQGIPSLPVSGGRESSAPSFDELLANTARGGFETIRAGDRAAVQGLRGELPVQQVVEATMAMESTLNLMVSVRDQVVAAYQEILRMGV